MDENFQKRPEFFIVADKNRKIVVVSAPKGVTDNLILIAKNSFDNKPYTNEFNKISEELKKFKGV